MGLFHDKHSNFYWNRFIFDRSNEKDMLAQFFSETRCTSSDFWWLWYMANIKNKLLTVHF